MDMRLRGWLLVFLGILVSCTPEANVPISLASFTQNYVEVSIYLERNANGDYFLLGTFTPPDSYHLYSKDIPLQGVDGLGRPTLLELTSNSQMRATGNLIESAKAQESPFEPRELLVYPQGAITLSLPIELPAGDGWLDDEIQVTYMACSASLCKPPVEGKIIPVRVPGVAVLSEQP